ncbi:MAG: TGS domain-containing protein [Dehalococcoidia bacterium]|nr:TGS domain-containing protein [Dehalococcoidia bacterium]
MPANLPPQYFEAEKAYRQARTIPEKIEALGRMLAIMPKHKGTDKLHGELRSKIAKLTEELERGPRSGRRGDLYHVKKEGAGQAALAGIPNSGKSQLVASLTDATPKVGGYPCTTQIPLSGMMPFQNVLVQLVDMPALTDRDALPWLHGVLRNADLLVLVIDLAGDPLEEVRVVLEALDGLGIRLASKSGGESSDGFHPPKPALLVGNKIDLDPQGGSLRRLVLEYGDRFTVAGVCALYGTGLEELREKIFQSMGIVRVYLKPPGHEADLTDPLILRRGSTIDNVAESVHKDIRRHLKYAQVWGSGKFAGQRVHRTYVLEDADIVELHV